MTLEQRVADLEHLTSVQARQIRSLRQQAKQFDSWLDTLASPPWKKLWWLCQGFRWYTVGRWRPPRSL